MCVSEGCVLISVVIPLYNKADAIVRTVQSVQAQTWADWELVVVDDGSTDQGAERVRALNDPRIRVLTQANAGVSVARNTGMLHARGNWVALLDADDYWRKDHLERLAALVQKYPDATLLGSSYGFEDERGGWRRVPIRSAYLQEPTGLVEVADFFADATELENLPVTSSSVLLPRELALTLGGFPAGITAGEDQLMWARMACQGRFALSVEPTSTYVEPAVSADNRLAVVRRPQLPDVVGTGFRFLLNKRANPKPLQGFIADWYRIRAVAWMELNERGQCLHDVFQAIRYSSLTTKDLICLVALCLPMSQRARLLAWRRERIRRQAVAAGSGAAP